MLDEYIGFFGMLLILLAWIPETIQNFREKGKNLNPKFVGLYLFGSLFLTYHALVLNDLVFLALNALASLMALFNLCLVLAGRKGKGKRRD